MKPIQMKTINGLISQAIERTEKYVEACKGNDNPQVIEMRLRAEGRLSALEDIEYALTRNDLVNLRILAGGVV